MQLRPRLPGQRLLEARPQAAVADLREPCRGACLAGRHEAGAARGNTSRPDRHHPAGGGGGVARGRSLGRDPHAGRPPLQAFSAAQLRARPETQDPARARWCEARLDHPRRLAALRRPSPSDPGQPETPRTRDARSLHDPQHDRAAPLDLPARAQTRTHRCQPDRRARAPRGRGAPRPDRLPRRSCRLLEALAAWPSTTGDVPLWATAFYAGLRRGELQALEWRRRPRRRRDLACGAAGTTRKG